MSFVQREIDNIRRALGTPESNPEYDRLYAAQQALAWALEPNGFEPPLPMITGGTQEGSKNCSADPRQPWS